MQKRQATPLYQHIGTIVLFCMRVNIIHPALPYALCTEAEIARIAHLRPVYRSMAVKTVSMSIRKLALYVYHSLDNTRIVFCSWWRKYSHAWEA